MAITAALAAAAAALAPLAGPAVPDPAPTAASTEVVEIGSDGYERLTVPVRVDGTGPYSFLIDTGAERTVLSRDLADRLGLKPVRRATIVGIAGRQIVDVVEVDEVSLGRRGSYAANALLLERAHLRAHGVVGLDGLRDQRVLLDFENGRMAVDRGRELGADRGYEIVVRARRRSRQLIMTNALIDGVRADVVIDTGSQMSIANRALQRKLARHRAPQPTSLISATGQELPADLIMVRSLTIGSLRLGNVSLAFADALPFAALGLGDKPAVFLGMSELRVFKRVAIDFGARKVLFDLPAHAGVVSD